MNPNKDAGTGVGLFEMRTESVKMSLGSHATSFQGEIMAIYTCVQIMVQRGCQRTVRHWKALPELRQLRIFIDGSSAAKNDGTSAIKQEENRNGSGSINGTPA